MRICRIEHAGKLHAYAHPSMLIRSSTIAAVPFLPVDLASTAA
jgi:hypothetical protein